MLQTNVSLPQRLVTEAANRGASSNLTAVVALLPGGGEFRTMEQVWRGGEAEAVAGLVLLEHLFPNQCTCSPQRPFQTLSKLRVRAVTCLLLLAML